MSWEDVLYFWFMESTPGQWFTVDPLFDQKIRLHFGTLYGQVIKGEVDAWRTQPGGRLAEIIVLDQFSRNLFRGRSEAFAQDARALALAREMVEGGYGDNLSSLYKTFMYMPYMHSESREVHEEALKLFTELGDPMGLKYEIKHKEIIDRFGRFPHRNQVLGRTSTPEEVEFLKTNPGF